MTVAPLVCRVDALGPDRKLHGRLREIVPVHHDRAGEVSEVAGRAAHQVSDSEGDVAVDRVDLVGLGGGILFLEEGLCGHGRTRDPKAEAAIGPRTMPNKLNCLVADLTLDKTMLQDALRKKW